MSQFGEKCIINALTHVIPDRREFIGLLEQGTKTSKKTATITYHGIIFVKLA